MIRTKAELERELERCVLLSLAYGSGGTNDDKTRRGAVGATKLLRWVLGLEPESPADTLVRMQNRFPRIPI